jgi:hypothetical protein
MVYHLASKYAEQKGLPAGWDLPALLAGVGSFLMSKVSIQDITPFQRLMDASVRQTLGRDRHGGLPSRLVVESVQEICHESNWTAYTTYQRDLGEKIAKKKCRRLSSDTLDWQWRPPKTAVKKTLKQNSFSDASSEIGLELSGRNIVGIHADGLVASYNKSVQEGSAEGLAIEVGDTITAVNGVSGDAALEKLRMLQRHGNDGEEFVLEVSGGAASVVPQPQGDLNEWWLWHGAPVDAGQSISAGQFKVELAGSHRGTMYGNGIYFAESVTKADEYTGYDGPDAIRCLLLCRVTMGHVLYNDDQRPSGFELARSVLDGTYDSILGDREACVGTHREFIVFNADAVYPNYVVFYKRVF